MVATCCVTAYWFSIYLHAYSADLLRRNPLVMIGLFYYFNKPIIFTLEHYKKVFYFHQPCIHQVLRGCSARITVRCETAKLMLQYFY